MSDRRADPDAPMASAPNPSDATDTAPAASAGDLSVTEAERYRPGRLLGVGGMGRVFLAHDRRLDREVAVKVPRAGAESPAAMARRLTREAGIIARFDHPGIVPVYDAGLTADGRAYYTMPVVRGRTLDDALRHGPDRRARARLLRRVHEACEAIAFAHRHGVVHRDLKPANIMLGEGGGARVLDWGLAHTRGGDADPATPTSGAGGAGTLAYMSPEQRRGGLADARSDVFALGAILYEVCSGRPLRGGPPGASGSAVPAERLGDGVPPELAAIVRRATEASPEARYADGQSLAEDLASFLDGRAVAAHRYSPRELLVRALRAWRGPLIGIAVGLAVVAALVVHGLTRLADEAERSQAATARAQASLAESLRGAALLHERAGARVEAERMAGRALAFGESPEMRGVLALWSAAPRPLLVERRRVPEPCEGVALDGAARRLLCRDPRGVSVWAGAPWGLRWSAPIAAVDAVWVGDDVVALARDQRVVSFDGATGERRSERALSSPSDTIAATGGWLHGRNTQLGWWIAGPGASIGRVDACGVPSLLLAFGVDPPTGRWAATCSDGRLVVGDVGAAVGAAASVLSERVSGVVAQALAFAGARGLVVGSDDGRVVIFDRDTGERRGALDLGLGKIVSLVATPGGDLAVARDVRGAVVAFDAERGVVRARLPARRARWHGIGDGEAIVVDDDGLERWRVMPGPPPWIDHDGGVTSVALDPGGRWWASATGARIDVRRLADGGRVLAAEAKGGFVKDIAFSPDGATLYAVSARDKGLRAWDTASWLERPRRDAGRHYRRVVAMAGGMTVAAPYAGGVVAYGPSWTRAALGDERLADLAAAGADAVLTLGEHEGTIHRWSPGLDEDPVAVGHDPGARAVASVGDAGAFITAGLGAVRRWEGGVGEAVFTAPGLSFHAVAVARGGRWIAAGAGDGGVWIWSGAARRVVAKVRGHVDRVGALAFDAAGNLLTSGGWDGRARLYGLDALASPASPLMWLLEAGWGGGITAHGGSDRLGGGPRPDER